MNGFDEMQRLYEKIPKSKCKAGCFSCCINSVQMTSEELEKIGGYTYIDRCPHLSLSEGKCTVYEHRPMVCRLYGTSELLKCENCVPEKFLDEEETREILREYLKMLNKK